MAAMVTSADRTAPDAGLCSRHQSPNIGAVAGNDISERRRGWRQEVGHGKAAQIGDPEGHGGSPQGAKLIIQRPTDQQTGAIDSTSRVCLPNHWP